MSKKTVIVLIIVLAVLNLAILAGVVFKAKVSADSLQAAASNTGSQNFSRFGLGATLPTKDVVGSDLPGVAKFKGLIRTKFETLPNGKKMVEYQAAEPGEVLLAYYKSALAKQGWTMDYADPNGAGFAKAGQRIALSTTNENGITTLSIVY